MTKFLKVIAIFIVLSLSSSAQFPTSSGFYFDGVDDRVTIPNIPAYNNLFNSDFSVEFWCRPDSGISTHNVMAIGDGTSSVRIEIVLKSNEVSGVFWDIPSGRVFSNTTPYSIYDGKCHHFVLVVKNKTVRLYTDGASFSNFSNTYNFPVIMNPMIIVGQDYINPQFNRYKGLISGIRFWKKALSQSEILNSYVAPMPQTMGVVLLVADWKFDNKYKQKVEDYSTYSNFGYKGFGLTTESSDPSYSVGCQSCIGSSISIQKLSSTAFCNGDSATLKVNIPSTFSCQWYNSGIAIPGQTDSIYIGKTNGVYSVILTDTGGCKKYSDAVVLRIYFGEVGKPIRPGVNPSSFLPVTCWWPGKIDSLQVGYNPLYTYQWLNSGVAIPNANKYKLTVTDTGEYTCLVSVGSCSLETNKHYVRTLRATIEPITPPITCLDTMVSLEVDLPWQYIPQYVWKVNGVVIPNGNSRYLNTSLTGSITCTVTDSIYCPLPAISPSIFLAHNSHPNLYINAFGFPLNVGQVINNCVGNSPWQSLELVDSYGFQYNDPGLQSVAWWGDYAFVQTGQNSIAVDKSGYYEADYTSVCGNGTVSKTVLFTGPNAIRTNIIGPISHCDSLMLSVDAPNYLWPGYQWYFNNSLIPGATSYYHYAKTSGQYFCVMNNSCDTIATNSRYANILLGNYKINPVNGTAICNGVPKQLQASGGSSFQWKKNGVVIPGATSSLYTATSTGTYSCLINGTCGSVSDTVIITNGTALVPPVVCISGEDSICPPSSNNIYSVSAVSGALHYSWILPTGAVAISNLDSTSINVEFLSNFLGGILYFVGINDCGADTLCSFYIHSLLPNPPVLLSGDLYGLCNVTKTYRCIPNPLFSSYVWSFPPSATILSGQGTDSVVVSFGTTVISGGLSVYGVSTTCMNSPSLNINLYSSPPPAGSIVGITSVCANQSSLTYYIQPVPGAISYQWTLPPGAIQTSVGNSYLITITMGSSSGQIRIAPQNICQIGTQVSKQLNVVCREGDVSGIENEFQIIASAENGILQFQIDGLNEIGAVKVVNSMGQVVTERDIASNEVVQLSGLSPGMYFITCISLGKKQTLKVVVY
ncbi:MAG: LamG-like jellyroll fold domain-containing protein [Bacteroidia bacterium]